MARETLDDGRVAITYEEHGGTIRLLPRVPTDDDPTPAWFGAGEVARINDNVASLSAFRAEHLTYPYMRLIARLLLARGYRVAYIERAGTHDMPGAEPMDHQDWAGWWRLDLVGMRLGRFMRRQRTSATNISEPPAAPSM
jgi:hypothetical protein